jgi:AcrR family transcriptional regulator
MSSRPLPHVRRKTTEVRRAEIVAAAGEVAVTEGLDSVTLRRVADTIGVFPGLVNHYFPSVDGLVAEAFGAVMARDRDDTFAMIEVEANSYLDRMRRLLVYLVSRDRHRISLLWLAGWHSASSRPPLQIEILEQMHAWQARLSELIAAGVAAGEFRADDPAAAAGRILVAIDGITVVAGLQSELEYHSIGELVVATGERELGLRRGRLGITV